MPPTLSIVIVNHRSARDTIACVASIRANRGCDPEVIVVDNDSGDAERALLAGALPGTTVHHAARNRGFGAGANAGVRLAGGTHLLFVNPDVLLVDPDTLSAMIEIAAATPRLGALGCRLRFADGRPQPSAHRSLPGLWSHAYECTPAAPPLLGLLGIRHSPTLYAERRHDERLVARHLLGAFLLVPRAAFVEVGGFDEGFFLYREETDLCVRLAASGRMILYSPRPQVIHHSGASTGNRDFASLDPRYLTSAYRYLALHRGAPGAAAAWLLGVAGLGASLPALLLLARMRSLLGGDARTLGALARRTRAALVWHARHRPSRRRPVRRLMA